MTVNIEKRTLRPKLKCPLSKLSLDPHYNVTTMLILEIALTFPCNFQNFYKRCDCIRAGAWMSLVTDGQSPGSALCPDTGHMTNCSDRQWAQASEASNNSPVSSARGHCQQCCGCWGECQIFAGSHNTSYLLSSAHSAELCPFLAICQCCLLFNTR